MSHKLRFTFVYSDIKWVTAHRIFLRGAKQKGPGIRLFNYKLQEHLLALKTWRKTKCFMERILSWYIESWEEFGLEANFLRCFLVVGTFLLLYDSRPKKFSRFIQFSPKVGPNRELAQRLDETLQYLIKHLFISTTKFRLLDFFLFHV